MKTIETVKDLEIFQKVSPKCSSKYVPMKTTTLVNSLKDFNFVNAHQYRKGSSAHYVRMSNGGEMNLFIENSFDRTMALRISFEMNGFIFGRIKQVHIGEGAVELLKNQHLINDWYSNASQTIDSLKCGIMSRNELEDIARIALKKRGVDIKTVQGVKYNQKNTFDFITELLYNIKTGGYTRHSKNGYKQIKEVNREALMIDINYKIWKYLEKNNPELYI